MDIFGGLGKLLGWNQEEKKKKPQQQAAFTIDPQAAERVRHQNNPVRQISNFAAGANEQFFGGAIKGATGLFNLLGSGFNQDAAKKKTDELLRATKQIDKTGNPHLSSGSDRDSDAFRVGQAVGATEGLVTDLATTAIPGAGAEKLLRGTTLAAKGLQNANRGMRMATKLAPIVGGGAVSSGISQLKNPDQNAGQNFTQGAAFDVASGLLGPLGSATARMFKGTTPNIPVRQMTGNPNPSRMQPVAGPLSRQISGTGTQINTPTQARGRAIQSPQPASTLSQVGPARSTPPVQSTVAPQQSIRQPTARTAASSIENPLNPRIDANDVKSQVRERGFATSVLDNRQTPSSVQAGLLNNSPTYQVRNTQDLVNQAGKLVSKNLDEAERIANTGSDDVAQAVGLELLRKYQMDGNYEAAIRRVEDIAEKATKNGQATQILAAYGRLTPEGALRFTQRQIDKFNDERKLVGSPKAARLTPDKAREVVEASKRVQALPEGLAKDKAISELTQIMGTAAPTPLMQKITSIWRAGLLTSARTVEGGIVGNTSKAILDIPSQAIAAAVDKFLTAPLLNRGVRSNVFTLKGAASGAKEGFRQAGDYLKTGVDPRNAAAGFDAKGINWEDGNKVVNAIGKKSDLVYRTMGAIDNPFYYSAKGRANFEEAYIEASRRGLKGAAKDDFVSQYADKLSDASNDAAIRTAKEAVFQNDTILGDFASKFKNLPKQIKDPVKRDAAQAIVDFTIPFAKIPGAVATALVDYSPAGVVLKTVTSLINKARGADLDIRALNSSIGKSATGSFGAVWLGNELYKRGMLTLEEPQDDKERQLWQAEGKQKFAIKIGGEWRSLNYVQPLGGLMALGGGYVRAQEQGDENPEVTAAATGLKSVTEQSFLKGISETIGLVTDPKTGGQNFVNGKVGSFVPNVVKDLARATDSSERETNNPLEALTNGIPGLRQDNLPQRDLYGEEIETKQSPAGVMLDPFKSTKAKSDVVTDELRRLYDINPKIGVVPTKLDKNETIAGTEVRLTPKQLDEFEKTVGPESYKKITEILDDPKYARLSDEDKSKKIGDVISATRNNAKKGFVESNTLLDKKGNEVVIDTSKLKTQNVNLKPTDGVGDTKLDPNTPSYKLLDSTSGLSKEEKKKWSTSKASKEFQPLLVEANKLKDPELPAFSDSNTVAELYASHQKELADNPDWSSIQKAKAQRKFVADAYDSQLSDNQKAIASLPAGELKEAVKSGQVSKADIDAIIAVDDIRNELGLSLKLSKKDRASLGYSAALAKTSTGKKKASGKGKKAKTFKAPKSSFNRVASTAGIRKLLQSSGKKIKEKV